jgi:NADP-dependent 3-hydroxy acid dehydrogenase YdfG
MKTILITGASRGIGQACAVELAKPNTHLILTATKTDNLLATQKQCEALGAKVSVYSLNLANMVDIKSFSQKIYQEAGAVDVLINNAGIWIEKPFLEGDMDEWDTALDVNLKSVIHLTRYTLEHMKDDSSLIFIASTASKRAYANGTNYCAAKYGLLGFTGALFEDVRERGIKVCSIFPGVVNTDMHAQDEKLEKEKMIQSEDIAKAVSYVLATPSNICPTELVIQPQKSPKKRA